MKTVQELLRSTAELPGDSPSRDVEILLAHCLGKTRTWLYTWPEVEVGGESLQKFQELLIRRGRGEPVAYLTGRREFWSLDLRVSPHTLIPRPETETLVEWALELQLPGEARAMDLGTGTGAIALALASERPAWRVAGLDRCEAAVELAIGNARESGLERVRFSQSDWFEAVEGERFHLLVSNPPYVETGDDHLNQGDVRFEPDSALVAAQGGLADLAHIVRLAPEHLYPQGWLLLEHGFDQGQSVRELLRDRGFSAIATRRDLAGHERVSGGCWLAD